MNLFGIKFTIFDPSLEAADLMEYERLSSEIDEMEEHDDDPGTYLNSPQFSRKLEISSDLIDKGWGIDGNTGSWIHPDDVEEIDNEESEPERKRWFGLF